MSDKPKTLVEKVEEAVRRPVPMYGFNPTPKSPAPSVPKRSEGEDRIAAIRARHLACVSDPSYPSIPHRDKFALVAHSHCVQVNLDRATLLCEIDSLQQAVEAEREAILSDIATVCTDWKNTGQPMKVYAAAYLMQRIRSRSKGEGNG